MKKTLVFLALSALALSTAAPTFADGSMNWAYNGCVILDVNGGGNTWYDLDSVAGNADFDSDNSSPQAYSLTITINQGQSIKLGGENQTWSEYPYDGTTSYLGYRVTTDLQSGSWNDLDLPYLQTIGEDNHWRAIGADMVEIGSSLSPGTYYLEIYHHAHQGTDNNIYQYESWEGGTNGPWEARIVVIPEAATALLGLVGMLPLCRRRR